ncbi:MAG: hypothetical protein AAGC71_00060 [Pseudomonadota bacterium]
MAASDGAYSKRSFGVAIFEVIAIIFGVVLGIWASEWYEDHERDQFVAESQRNMLDELRANYAKLVEARQYHLDLLPKTIADRDARQQGKEPLPYAYRGFGTAKTTTAAYDTAVNATVFAYLEPDDSQAIVNAYRTIESLNAVDGRYRLANAMAAGTGRFVDIVPIAFGDFLWAEDEAMQAIAPLIGEEAPDFWITELDETPY